MSASFLRACERRRADALAPAARAPPALTRASTSSSLAPSAPTLDGVFSFGVCDALEPDLHVLGKLARTCKSMRREVEALERVWMRACLTSAAGFREWLDHLPDQGSSLFDGTADARGWMGAYGALMRCRDTFLTGVWHSPPWASSTRPNRTAPLWGPCMALDPRPGGAADRCDLLASTCHDGDIWTRMPRTSPRERAVRDAFSRLAMLSPSLLAGLGDPQCDALPVCVALYTRAIPAPYADTPDGSEHSDADAGSDASRDAQAERWGRMVEGLSAELHAWRDDATDPPFWFEPQDIRGNTVQQQQQQQQQQYERHNTDLRQTTITAATAVAAMVTNKNG